MFKLTPGNNRFYDLFDRAAELQVRAAAQFLDLVENFGDQARRAEEIKRVEHELDEVVHDTMKLLHSSFITPIERGDIRRLIQGLDSVADGINAASSRLALYEIDDIYPPIQSLARVLLDSCRVVQGAVGRLRGRPKIEEVLPLCVEINRLEDQADQIYREALAHLFRDRLDPLLVIKWKEICEFVESATDCCEDVADMVEVIVIENA
jgi:predicted phosphate transport protein (TIGR00153 family)